MKKFLISLLTLVILGVMGFIYYYFALPAINIHSHGFWWFIVIALLVVTIAVGLMFYESEHNKEKSSKLLGKIFQIFCGGFVLLLLVYFIGMFLSSPVVNASKYQKLLTISDRNYTDDIKEISYKDIPILDKDSAILLGSRKMGSIPEYVSQFEVADIYTQINYQGAPVRVTPLKYGSIFKWLSNRSQGIPAYMKIDMTTQQVELVKLEEGLKYSKFERFGRNINRHLRFNYPTYIFDNINFEIGEDGVPYWICPVKEYTIGLFGGKTIGRVVVVNAVTGELADYSVDEVPDWVDKVFSADLLISSYDYYGTLKHGFWNSVFGQRDALQTTDGYNYIAMEDSVWVYTGVTSVGADESNIGFVLMNQRTSETRFYSVAGAEEYSAMASAEGQVQHLGYKATFPLLLNIGGEPTYFIALKDEAGLVKKYAMVNIAQYQIVAIGDTINECEKVYLNLLDSSGVTVVDTSKLMEVTGVIEKIAENVVEGNTHYLILLENKDEIFDIKVNDFVSIIKYNVGDRISFTYTQGLEANTVLDIK